MRIAVVSDVHSNLVALDAVLRIAGSVDETWHLGDVVGYGPDPNGTVARLRALGVSGVQGNHDAAAVGGPEIEWFNRDARVAMEWTRTAIDEPTRGWLAGLPTQRQADDVTLVHGSLREPTWEYVTSVPVARANLALLETRTALFGHTHLPIAYLEEDGRIDVVSPGDGSVLELRGRRALINPGSVGQPRDGDPRSAFLVLDTGADTVTWHRVEYDVAAVQAGILAAGLPSTLASRLEIGL